MHTFGQSIRPLRMPEVPSREGGGAELTQSNTHFGNRELRQALLSHLDTTMLKNSPTEFKKAVQGEIEKLPPGKAFTEAVPVITDFLLRCVEKCDEHQRTGDFVKIAIDAVRNAYRFRPMSEFLEILEPLKTLEMRDVERGKEGIPAALGHIAHTVIYLRTLSHRPIGRSEDHGLEGDCALIAFAARMPKVGAQSTDFWVDTIEQSLKRLDSSFYRRGGAVESLWIDAASAKIRLAEAAYEYHHAHGDAKMLEIAQKLLNNTEGALFTIQTMNWQDPSFSFTALKRVPGFLEEYYRVAERVFDKPRSRGNRFIQDVREKILEREKQAE